MNYTKVANMNEMSWYEYYIWTFYTEIVYFRHVSLPDFNNPFSENLALSLKFSARHGSCADLHQGQLISATILMSHSITL